MNIYKIGCNLCAFSCDLFRFTLEYDFNLGGFREKSDYLMCKNYEYNGRVYGRDKFGNMPRYYRLLSGIDPETWRRAAALFE